MTKVSFYILATTDPLDRQQFACRLAEKAYLQGHQVFINTEDQNQSEAMDKALWAFRPDSFVPHQIFATDNKIEAPVLISHENTAPPKLMDVLIRLSHFFLASLNGWQKLLMAMKRSKNKDAFAISFTRIVAIIWIRIK